MAENARAALKRELAEECAAREERRSELIYALIALDNADRRIDVLLARLAKLPA